jgi:hypothetical protein
VNPRLEELIALGHALRNPVDPLPLVALGRERLDELTRGHSAFVRLTEDGGDALRARWLGETALRYQRLPPHKRVAIGVLGAVPDLLAPAGRRYDELLHTNTIAWVLGRTTFRVEARRRFLKAVEEGIPRNDAAPFSAATFDAQGAIAIAERSVGRFGRVDVWLETPAHVIAIEGKILAQEGKDQVPRYNDARRLFPGKASWTVVFLTVDLDQEPSGPALHLTFTDLLRAWLPLAAAGDTGEHRHLGLYLASVARLCGIGASGGFDTWTFTERRKALDLLQHKDTPE